MTYSDADYYAANREKILARNRQHYAENREAIKKRRSELIAKKPKRIPAGKPCKYGHISERSPYIGCLECHKIRERLARQKRRKPKIILSAEEKRERQRAANRASYKKRGPGYTSLQIAKRKARIAGNGGNHTLEDREWVWRLQGGKCGYAKFGFSWCHIKLTNRTRHWDHIVPIYLGGSNDRSNGQWLCPSCNSRKGHKKEDKFLRQCGVEDLFVMAA